MVDWSSWARTKAWLTRSELPYTILTTFNLDVSSKNFEIVQNVLKLSWYITGKNVHMFAPTNDLLVQFSQLLDQTFLTLVRLFERSVQFLIFDSEMLQTFITHKFLENFLKLNFQLLQIADLQPQLLHVLLRSLLFVMASLNLVKRLFTKHIKNIPLKPN
jgi:hypothetical protein